VVKVWALIMVGRIRVDPEKPPSVRRLVMRIRLPRVSYKAYAN